MADFRAQRRRNERLRQARLKKKSSGSSRSSQSRASRRDELIRQGLGRAEASQIANAEASGQKITNVQTLSTKAQSVARSSGLEAKSKRRLTPSSVAEIKAGRVFSTKEKSRLRFKNEERNLKKKLLGFGLSQSESTIRARELAQQGVTASRLNLLEARQRIEASREREKLSKIKGKSNFRGLIQGKVYTNLTQGEILNNKLNKNTNAKLLPSQTSQRRNFVEAKSNLEAGRGTTYDISAIATKGKGGAFGIQESKVRVLALLKKDLEKKAIRRTKKPIAKKYSGVISAYVRPKGTFFSEITGLEKVSSKLQMSRALLRNKKIRLEAGNNDIMTIGPTALKLWGLTIASAIIDTGKGVTDLPPAMWSFAKNPKLILKLPTAIKRSLDEFALLIRTSPDEALIRVGAEMVLAKGLGSLLDDLGRTSKGLLTKLDYRYRGTGKVGSEIVVKTATGKTGTLKVVGKIPISPIRSQLELAGKTVNAISSQADELLGFIRSRSKLIKKPISGRKGAIDIPELKFSTRTKKLLKKFDDKIISRDELVELNKRLITSEKSKGLLERSFFADPTGNIRPSRLGLVKKNKASLIDFLTGDFTFRKQKPQILFFEDVKVQTFPKGYETIVRKLKKGTVLTQKESDILLNFQLQKTGKFKPLGFVSGESEITLAPTEVIKRIKVIGKVKIKGVIVDIVQVKVVKPKGVLGAKLKELRTGTLKPKELPKLDKALKKFTGIDYKLSSYVRSNKYINVKGLLSHVLIRATSSFIRNIYKNLDSKSISYLSRSKYKKYIPASSKSRTSKPASSKKPLSRKTSTPKRTPKPTSRKTTSPTSTSKPTSRKTSSPKKTSITSSPKKSPPKKSQPKKPVPVKGPPKNKLSWDKKPPKGFNYLVEARVKVRGNIKVLKKTTPNRALALNRRVADNTLVRSMDVKIVGLTKKKDIKRPSLNKFRLKKSRGSKVLVLVEKSKYAIDTKGEKRGLSISKYLKKRKIVKNKPKRRKVTKKRTLKRRTRSKRK